MAALQMADVVPLISVSELLAKGDDCLRTDVASQLVRAVTEAGCRMLVVLMWSISLKKNHWAANHTSPTPSQPRFSTPTHPMEGKPMSHVWGGAYTLSFLLYVPNHLKHCSSLPDPEQKPPEKEQGGGEMADTK